MSFIALIMEAVRNSETSVYSWTTWQYIPEDSKLHIIVVFNILIFGDLNKNGGNQVYSLICS
jgi:hypothetical protein